MKFIGGKNDQDLFDNLIKQHIPENLNEYDYIEPFGGSFGLSKVLEEKPKRLIYNDLIRYDVEIEADIIKYTDYRNILNTFDDIKSVIYIDPPYYGKEYLYGLESNDNKFHEDLREEVKNRKSKILISYEDCSFIRRLYSGCEIHYYSGENKYKKKEMLIVI